MAALQAPLVLLPLPLSRSRVVPVLQEGAGTGVFHTLTLFGNSLLGQSLEAEGAVDMTTVSGSHVSVHCSLLTASAATAARAAGSPRDQSSPSACHRYCGQNTRHRGMVAYPLAIQHVRQPVTLPPPDREAVFGLATKKCPPDRCSLRRSPSPAHDALSFL